MGRALLFTRPRPPALAANCFFTAFSPFFSYLPVQLPLDHPKYFLKRPYFPYFSRYSRSVNFRNIADDISNWGRKKLIRCSGKATGGCPRGIEPKNQGGEKL